MSVETRDATPAQSALRDEDQRVYFRPSTWKDYEVLLALREERSVPRITYLEGVVELTSPSERHERFKELLGRPGNSKYEVRRYAVAQELRHGESYHCCGESEHLT